MTWVGFGLKMAGSTGALWKQQLPFALVAAQLPLHLLRRHTL